MFAFSFCLYWKSSYLEHLFDLSLFFVCSLPLNSFQTCEFQAMCEWRASLGCSELLCPLQTPVSGLWVVVLEHLFIWQLQRRRGKERYEIWLTTFGCLLHNNCQSDNPSLFVVMMLLLSTSTQVCVIDASVRIQYICVCGCLSSVLYLIDLHQVYSDSGFRSSNCPSAYLIITATLQENAMMTKIKCVFGFCLAFWHSEETCIYTK